LKAETRAQYARNKNQRNKMIVIKKKIKNNVENVEHRRLSGAGRKSNAK
jgi:hypothetical protein